MKGKRYAAHRCPRCLEFTTAKFYCAACVAVLKRPGRVAPRNQGLFTKWEYRRHGWDATALGLLVAVMLSLSLAGPVRAADAWSNRDVALEVTYAALHVVDWGQTLHIAKNPQDHRELNPLFGEHPHPDKVSLLFAGGLVGHALVTHLLPADWRPWWQAVTIGIEGSAVGWNMAAGIRVDF